MGDFENNANVLVADVDCTAEGSKELCTTHGVEGYPSLKHGNPAALEDYEGAREYEALSTFAKGLKPLCSPNKRELCDPEDRAEIEKFEKLSIKELEKSIKEGEKKIKSAESKYKRQVESLQNKYQRYTKSKDKKIAKIKAAGLSTKKAVLAYKKKNEAA